MKEISTYHSPLFNKSLLELSDLKNSPTRSSLSKSRPVLPPRISSKIIEENILNDEILRLSNVNEAQSDSFLETYDRISNSIRIGLGNNHLIPKKKRIMINDKFMHDLANNKINNKNYSLNVSPCITMKPIVDILLKSIEVVVNEKTKSHNDNLKPNEDNKNGITGLCISESPQPSPSVIITSTENTIIQSEDPVEDDTNLINVYKDNKRSNSNNSDSIIVKSPTEESNNTENKNSSLYNDSIIVKSPTEESNNTENINSNLYNDSIIVKSPTEESNNTENINSSLYNDSIIVKSPTEDSNSTENTNSSLLHANTTNTLSTFLSLKSYKTLKGEGKAYKDILLDSESFKQLYNSISRDINLIESITKSEKEPIEPISFSQNDISDTYFISNQNIEVNNMERENVKIEGNENNINDMLFSTDSISKTYNDFSTDLSTIDKTAVNKLLVDEDNINNNQNESEVVNSIQAPNPPVKLLRRSSSLDRKKDLSKKFDSLPIQNLKNKNGITGIMDNQHKRYTSDNFIGDQNKYSQFINTSDTNNTNIINNTNITNNFKNTNVNTDTNDNQIINILPLITERRSSMSKKHQSVNLPIRNGNQSNEIVLNPVKLSQNNHNNNNNNSNNNLLPNNMKYHFNNMNNKRFSTNIGSMNRNINNNNYNNNNNSHRMNPVLYTPKRSPDASLKNKSPKPIYSPDADASFRNMMHTPKHSQDSSIRNKATSPKHSQDMDLTTTSTLSIEIPPIPDNMEKQKSSRMSKTFSYIKALSPQSLNKKSSKSEVELPSIVLFDDDNRSQSSSKSKRFSITSLKNKVIRKASKDSYKKNSKDHHRNSSIPNVSTIQSYDNSSPESFKYNPNSPLQQQINEDSDSFMSNSGNHSIVPNISHRLINNTNINIKNSTSFEKDKDINNSKEIKKQEININENNQVINKYEINKFENQEIKKDDDKEKIRINEISRIENQEIKNNKNKGKEEEKSDEKNINENKIMDDDNNNEWIDEIDYDNNNNNNNIHNRSHNTVVGLKKSGTKNKKHINPRRRNTHNKKYNGNSIKRGKSTTKTLEKNGSVRYREGSIRYRRSTKKYTVIKNGRNLTPSSALIKNVNASSPSFIKKPVLNLPPHVTTKQITSGEFKSDLNQPIYVTENDNQNSSQFLSPNQITVASTSKGDTSFTSISGVSTVSNVSSVKLKKNIMRKIFHLNFKKRQNKLNQQPANRTYRGNYFSNN